MLETLNIWTHLWDQSRTKVCTSKIWTLSLAYTYILWNSSKLNSTPVHGKVCKPDSFLPFLLEKIAWGLQTPSASAQTQHSPCLPLRHKIKGLEKRRLLVGMMKPSVQRCDGWVTDLRWHPVHPAWGDPDLGRQLSRQLCPQQAETRLVFRGVHNSALHLTCAITDCSRWNLLQMLTLSKANLSESFLF